jgi:hypothetical protein
MQIPYAILKAKEQATDFGRRVDHFRSLYREPSPEAGEELYRLLEEFGCSNTTGWQRGWHSLTTVVDLALQWAVKSVPPPIDALREARACLEAASAGWANSWGELAWFVKGWRLESSPSGPINDSATMAQAEWTRVAATLEERWPVVSREQEASEAMNGAAFVELDDAFARLAGVTKEAWQARVEEHKQRRVRPPNQE